MGTGEILAELMDEEEAKAPSQVKLESGRAHSMSASEGPDSSYYTSRGLLWEWGRWGGGGSFVGSGSGAQGLRRSSVGRRGQGSQAKQAFLREDYFSHHVCKSKPRSRV